MAEASEEVYSSLRRDFKGDLLRPGQSGYEDAGVVWNGMVARTPGIIVRCVVDLRDGKRFVSQMKRAELTSNGCRFSTKCSRNNLSDAIDICAVKRERDPMLG
jgi:hypothetical protein